MQSLAVAILAQERLSAQVLKSCDHGANACEVGYHAYNAGSKSQNGGQWGCSLGNPFSSCLSSAACDVSCAGSRGVLRCTSAGRRVHRRSRSLRGVSTLVEYIVLAPAVSQAAERDHWTGRVIRELVLCSSDGAHRASSYDDRSTCASGGAHHTSSCRDRITCAVVEYIVLSLAVIPARAPGVKHMSRAPAVIAARAAVVEFTAPSPGGECSTCASGGVHHTISCR